MVAQQEEEIQAEQSKKVFMEEAACLHASWCGQKETVYDSVLLLLEIWET